jgi:hypothetical protein
MAEYDPLAVPRILSWDAAQRRGFTESAIRHLVRCGDWTRILPGTYLTSDTCLWTDRLYAATTYAGPGALLSGAAALCDRGLKSVGRPDSILVLAPPGIGPHSTGWVRIRRSARPMARELCPGPPRAQNARAVADLAVVRRRQDDVRALVAEAVRNKMCTADELVTELSAGPRRGSAYFRQAIDEVAAGAWSAPEARAGRLLRHAGVRPFEQNRRIDLPNGRWRYVDFIWLDLAAVLEIDSDEFHSLPPDADATDARHEELTRLDYEVIHRRPVYIRDHPDEFIRGVITWLDYVARLRAARAS